jgi:hypothetical protein
MDQKVKKYIKVHCPALARVSFRTGVVEDRKRANRRRGSKEWARVMRRDVKGE